MKKIGFNERPHQQAVFDGKKPMTRRLEKKLQKIISEYERMFKMPFSITSMKWNEAKKGFDIWTPHSYVFFKPRYGLNEIVAVAQSYDSIKRAYKGNIEVWSNIVANTCDGEAGATNKMFVRANLMPHQIQITDIRIEQLQDISDDDCLREVATARDWHRPKIISSFGSPKRASTIT